MPAENWTSKRLVFDVSSMRVSGIQILYFEQCLMILNSETNLLLLKYSLPEFFNQIIIICVTKYSAVVVFSKADEMSYHFPMFELLE